MPKANDTAAGDVADSHMNTAQRERLVALESAASEAAEGRAHNGSTPVEGRIVR